MATNVHISLPFPSIPRPRSHYSQNTHNSYIFSTSLSLSTNPTPTKTIHFFNNPIRRNHQREKRLCWKIFATPEEVLPSDSTTLLDNSQEIVSFTSDEGVATIIQTLLLVAFLALTILTIGVIYIAVQDFLQKREKEKYEKEEASTKKNGKKKKKKVTSRAGPRGFGQKIDDDDEI